MLYLVMGLIGGLQTSGQVYVLTGGQGGPDCASIMIDTHLPLIIPNFFGGAFNIFLLRQTIMRIPRSFDEAAQVEGAGYFRVWCSIILPMVKPILHSHSHFYLQLELGLVHRTAHLS